MPEVGVVGPVGSIKPGVIVIMQRGVMFVVWWHGLVLVWFGTVCGVCYGGRGGKRGEETRSCVEVASEVRVGRYCVLL